MATHLTKSDPARLAFRFGTLGATLQVAQDFAVTVDVQFGGIEHAAFHEGEGGLLHAPEGTWVPGARFAVLAERDGAITSRTLVAVPEADADHHLGLPIGGFAIGADGHPDPATAWDLSLPRRSSATAATLAAAPPSVTDIVRELRACLYHYADAAEPAIGSAELRLCDEAWLATEAIEGTLIAPRHEVLACVARLLAAIEASDALKARYTSIDHYARTVARGRAAQAALLGLWDKAGASGAAPIVELTRADRRSRRRALLASHAQALASVLSPGAPVPRLPGRATAAKPPAGGRP